MLSYEIAFTPKTQASTHLRNCGADDEPCLLLHEQEVVAQQYSVFLLITCQQCQELLRDSKRTNL